MQTIADLVTEAAKSKVFQRSAMKPGVEPIGKDALVGPAELTRSGEDSAPVDENRETERLAKFEREDLRGQLGGAVKRHGGAGGKGLVDSGGGNARRQGLTTGSDASGEIA